MSEQKIFIAGFFPDAKSIEESGARAVANAFYAKDLKHAEAKAGFIFIEEYPGAQDAAFIRRVCEATEGVPCPDVSGGWDESFFDEHDWPADSEFPLVRTTQPSVLVDLNKISTVTKIAALVKYGHEEITEDLLPAALELIQDEASTFEGHIVEAINKTPDIANMYPERILHAIGWVRAKCAATKKWPEIKAELANWRKRLEGERGSSQPSKSIVDIVREQEAQKKINQEQQLQPGSGDPDRFDMLVALLVMGRDPAAANATDVKNAREIIKIRDSAWRAWRTTLAGIPGIYHFPESELYRLTIDGMKNLKLINDNDARVTYVQGHFAGHELLPDYPRSSDIVVDEQGRESVTERQGPFYYRAADGNKIGRANKLVKLEAALASGCVEISQEEYQARKNGTHTEPQDMSENPVAQTEVKKIANGVFSVENLMAENVNPDIKTSSNEVEKTESAMTQPATPAFQTIGAALENDLAEKGDNLKIWRQVMRTDPRYTKDLAGAGFDGTSINAEYMIMRATEIFGPIGTGWGFEVLEDRMIPGAPMSEPIYEDKKFIGNRLLRDGDGTLITEQNHSIKIAFWYLNGNGIAERFEAYGATKYLYKTKHGITCDGEAQKKSLTDAIKKALSLLGFSADVWLGLYDQAEYKQENATEFAIKNASDRAEDVTRLRQELDDKLTRNASTIEGAVSVNEAKKIFDTIAREVEVHRKSAESRGDAEHAKYLSGRLRRLTQIRDAKITALNEKQEQAA